MPICWVSDAVSSKICCDMSQNAVNPVEELRIVKTQAEQMSVRDGKHLSYEQYVSLLLSAAQALDGHYTTKVNTRGIKRSVHNTDVNDTDQDASFDDNFNIDYDDGRRHATKP